MVECYVGEIRMFAGSYAPVGWAMCDGQMLPIAGNEALYSLIGVTYGGDGVSTFRLPDMRGRVPISAGARAGANYVLGQAAGTETVTLTGDQLPKHTHPVNAQSATGTLTPPTNGVWAGSAVPAYETAAGASLVAMNPEAVGAAGAGQPHENMMPFMTLSFIIALSGIYPNN